VKKWEASELSCKKLQGWKERRPFIIAAPDNVELR